MILTPKERAYLKGLANRIDQRYLLGKGGCDEKTIELLDKALEAKELIKVSQLSNSKIEAETLIDELVKKLNCGLVQHIGRVYILYRPSVKNKRIDLSLAK